MLPPSAGLEIVPDCGCGAEALLLAGELDAASAAVPNIIDAENAATVQIFMTSSLG